MHGGRHCDRPYWPQHALPFAPNNLLKNKELFYELLYGFLFPREHFYLPSVPASS